MQAGAFAAVIARMKSRFIFCSALAALCGLFLLTTPDRSHAQTDEASPQLTALIKDVIDQQNVITDNQKKIDEKIADIKENVRVARIWAAQGK